MRLSFSTPTSILIYCKGHVMYYTEGIEGVSKRYAKFHTSGKHLTGTRSDGVAKAAPYRESEKIAIDSTCSPSSENAD